MGEQTGEWAMDVTKYQLVVDLDPEDEDAECYSVFTDVPGAMNAEVAGRIGERDYAYLFAAAPDLLAAAQMMLAMFDKCIGVVWARSDKADAAGDALRAAIAKALGDE